MKNIKEEYIPVPLTLSESLSYPEVPRVEIMRIMDEYNSKLITYILKNKINSIIANKEKGITTVVFKDGKVKMSKLAKGDHYDASIGVALSMAYEIFGSKTQFKKFVEENARVIEKKDKKEKVVKEK